MTADMLSFAKVHVLGGAHIDMIAAFTEMPIPHASNPATIEFMPGGGGLNMASALAALGTPVRLTAPVGADQNGVVLYRTCATRGIEAQLIESGSHPTGIYAGLVTPTGDLTIGAADLRQNDLIDANWTDRHFLPGIGSRDLILLTANMSIETLQHVAENRNGARLAAAAISPAKAKRLVPLLDQLDLLFCNRAEAQAITGLQSGNIADLAESLKNLGLKSAIVTNGPAPAHWWADGKSGSCAVKNTAPVVNVNGAGDCLSGTVLASLGHGMGMQDALENGMAAASLAVQTTQPVPAMLDWSALPHRL